MTKHRPLLRLLFSPHVKEVTGFFGHNEWILIYPLSRKSQRWQLLSYWLTLRDRTNSDGIAIRVDRLPVRKRLVEAGGGRRG